MKDSSDNKITTEQGKELDVLISENIKREKENPSKVPWEKLHLEALKTMKVFHKA